MHRLYRPAALALTSVLAASAWGQNGPSTESTPAAPAVQGETADRDRSAPPPAPKFEGAIGLVMVARPAFSGSSDRKISPQLAGFLRYGRYTVTGAGGFTTRRQDDVERGLDAELVRREHLRMNLSLRYDPGRRESASDQLSGMGNIKPTVRARLGLRWEPAPNWSASIASSIDSFGRGGGYLVDAGLSRTFALDARQRLSLGVGATAAGDRYLQTWYGVTEAQSAASGYPVYSPSEGLRDVGASVTWRIEVNPQWAGFASLGVGHLLGGAAGSPLTTQRNSMSLSAGIARRF